MRIAVVEDEAPIREGLGNILGKLDPGYELVGKARNGREGLELVKTKRPDLIILDIRMPDMDGLTMLAHIREEKIDCRAVILSAYSDFNYAKRAIELGIDNYLLKPIKVPELKHVLKEIADSVAKDQSKDHLLSLEHVFLNAITGQLEDDEQLAALLKEKYGLSEDAPIAIFGVGMGDNYEQYNKYVQMVLEEMGIHGKGFRAFSIDFPKRRAYITILYHLENVENTRLYIENTIAQMLCSKISGKLVMSWNECQGLLNVRSAVTEAEQRLEWNLILGKKVLISRQKIEEVTTYPLKYPLHLETQAKESLDAKDEKAFKNVWRKLRDYCREIPCTPQDMKETMTRLAFNLAYVAAEMGASEAKLQTQKFLKVIAEATSWRDVEGELDHFFDGLIRKNVEKEEVSLLIQKALQYTKQYYNQGITLEEISEKLHISEEYLSSQFKKETGSTFTETIRKIRIEHVKELLLKSSLKLNQIADMAGYSDPKYMSKVFKEEVGMLPLEYRKKNG
ncbi:response regulator [Faecalicatena contorta]|uniref:response regulator n=1 Tax=Faecalicatena contorta TaxID=39482 RepID=UPI001F20AF48|nr:response regulator [Faecalicatena contorta]MCF2682281.1 response regulator [Faecalicatena contorta]